MNLDKFTGPGSTPSRRRFWDKVTEAVIASQKIAGRNVSVDEHQGYGTLINVPNPTRRPTPGGTVACCFDDITCEDLSPEDCIAAGGTPRATGTSCSDNDGNGCCIECLIVSTYDRGCTDGDGNQWTGPENCDGTCEGVIITGYPDTRFLTNYQYCLTCPENTIELCRTESYDPVTCEFTVVGDCDDCDGPGQGTTQSVHDPYIVCP